MTFRQLQAYDASKEALYYAAHSMAASLWPRIRVNAISPGVIATDAMQAVCHLFDNPRPRGAGRNPLRAGIARGPGSDSADSGTRSAAGG